MKKIMLAAAVLTAAISLFAGCGDKSGTPATIDGSWMSEDGSVLTIEDGTLSLRDGMGRNILAQETLPCEHRGDFLYLSFDSVEAKVFEVSLEDDSLTLKYTVEVQADMRRTYDQPIVLTRSEG